MEQNNKFFVYDSLVFGIKNALTNMRVLVLAWVTWFIACIPLIIIGATTHKALFTTLATTPTSSYVQVVIPYLVQGSTAMIVLSILVFTLFLCWLGIGMVRIGLRIQEKGTADLATFFPSPLLLIKVFIGALIFITILLLGLICFVIPGIYFLVRSWFYVYALADGDGIFEAFSTSFRITQGKGWHIYALFLASMVIGAATWFFGGLILVVSNAYAYRLLKKEA